LILGSVAVTYWRYIVKRDYIVQAQTDCDPETENCFIWECDPESDADGEKCTGDPEKDIWYYKIIRRNAMRIPDCPASPAGGDPEDENCMALVCDEGEPECSEELCTAESVPEGESCNDPVQYLLENPPEESVECEEGDEECQAAADEECAPDDESCVAEEEDAGGSDEKPADENSDETSPGSVGVPAAASESM